ncbi:ATP-binding protein [uncultured Clostridium sp.]|uniref:sensor histidine kinase n=2 Tax=uncultured Clostridium sp. TaxID=59620 RepID=UPI0026079E61|nr:ATP-binding protein [uncultured Clostridium sp.]
MGVSLNNVLDVINTIIQVLTMVVIINYCLDDKNKISKFKQMLLTGILSLIVIIITHLFGNSCLGSILTHLSLILIVIIVFKKDAIGAIISISIIMLAIVLNVLIMNILYILIFHNIIPKEYYYVWFTLMYIAQFVMEAFILLNKEFMYKIYLTIRSKKISIISMINITLVIEFAASYQMIINDLGNSAYKGMSFILLGLFIIGIILYYSNIENKSKEILLLNKELEEKITELKKVKHDYGAQISYLYGMHLMGRYEKLGESLKAIINGHENIVSEVEITNNDSLISMIVNSIKHKGINVIIDEQASLEDISIPEMEMQRVISNIFKNSVTAMDEKGVIIIRTYYNMDNVVIKIQNNGPKIEDEIIGKIFNAGFTTKKDICKDHGFGLAIVKEIIEKHKGSVAVESNTEITEFTLKIPKKH